MAALRQRAGGLYLWIYLYICISPEGSYTPLIHRPGTWEMVTQRSYSIIWFKASLDSSQLQDYDKGLKLIIIQLNRIYMVTGVWVVYKVGSGLKPVFSGG